MIAVPTCDYEPKTHTLTDDERETVNQAVNRIHEKAVPGLAYSAVALANEAGVEFCGPAYFEALRALIGHHKWQRLASWGLFIPPGVGRPSTSAIIDAATVPGYPFGIDQIGEYVEALTGEEPTKATLRRALDRLVQTGAWSRPKKNLYKRIHRGM